jgi:hypothetical protein
MLTSVSSGSAVEEMVYMGFRAAAFRVLGFRSSIKGFIPLIHIF